MKNFTRILILFILLPASSCIFEDKDDCPYSYVFVEQFTTHSGVLLSGPEPPSLQIDFPMYQYNEGTKTLSGQMDFDITDDLKLIFGSGTCLSGTAGGGCASGLTGIYEIPFEQGLFKINKVENDGSIIGDYNGNEYTLAAGEEYSYSYSYQDTVDVDGLSSISEITSTLTISNFGFIEKENISTWEW